MESHGARPTTPAPLQNKVVCVLEWVLAVCLKVVVALSFCGVLDIQHLQNAMSSVSFPGELPNDESHIPSDDEYFTNLILNLEIILLVFAQLALSLLLLSAVKKNSREMYKIWMAVHVMLTCVICLPLLYQYALMTSIQRSNILIHGGIQVMIAFVWILYRILSLLIILTHLLQKPGIKTYVQL